MDYSFSFFRKTPKTTAFFNTQSATIRIAAVLLLFVGCSFVLSGYGDSANAAGDPNDWKIGERLTYTISFNSFDGVAYAEISAVSKGKLSGRDAVELSAKLRSVDLFSAAFYQWDESRTTYVAADTGFPLYVKHVSNTGILPRETVFNHLEAPSPYLDLVSMIYQVRKDGGSGSYSVSELEQIHSFNFTITGLENVTTDAGEFDTLVAAVESSYFSQFGITNVIVNFSNDGDRIPVLMRFRMPQGNLTAKIASIQLTKNVPAATPVPTPVATPKPSPTPAPTPPPYVDNRDLSPDFPFRLGETMDFAISKGEVPIGRITLRAAERKLFRGSDSLLLSATASVSSQANSVFGPEDRINVWADPESLAPIYLEMNLSGPSSIFSQKAGFDQATGTVNIEGRGTVEVPVGTHSLLSLAYAVRSFNLRPGINPGDPVNDTRVSLLLGNSATVVTLRPSGAEIIEYQGRKVSAQPVSIRTGNPSVDALAPKIWLSNDARRLPLRFTISDYRADLVAVRRISPN